jgi:hypothetical protein
MTDVSQAVDIVSHAAPDLSRLGRALVVAIGGHETHWSDAFPQPSGAPSYNWGAVTAGNGWTGPTFDHADSRWTPAGNVAYVTKFRVYDSTESGAADLARILKGQYKHALAAADRGDWLGVARALYDGDDNKPGGGYYSGTKPRNGAILDYFNALRKQLEAQGIPIAAVGAAAGAELLFWGAVALLAVRRLKRHGRR